MKATETKWPSHGIGLASSPVAGTSVAIAHAAQSEGRSVFVLALGGMANPDLQAFPHAWVSLGELGKAIKLLKEAQCSEITLAGKVARPEFSKLKLDARGASRFPA
jgi:DUF1009 family protein